METALLIFTFILFGVVIFFFFKMMWHFWYMNQNLIGKYSGFIGPFVLFMPNQFNNKGNEHREKFIKFLALVLVSFLCFFGLYEFLGI